MKSIKTNPNSAKGPDKGKQIVLHIKGKRLYCCFIDYIKAFDSVAHV